MDTTSVVPEPTRAERKAAKEATERAEQEEQEDSETSTLVGVSLETDW